jgi:hypothetical protein
VRTPRIQYCMHGHSTVHVPNLKSDPMKRSCRTIFNLKLQTWPKMMIRLLISTAALVSLSNAFQVVPTRHQSYSTRLAVADNDLSTVLNERFPSSVEDQVRQASEALKRASQDGYHRHTVRLLLPLIGASELDDWPGGTRQMAQAADPLMQDVLKNMGAQQTSISILDESDGVGAIMAQAEDPRSDSCTVLLPSADTVTKLQSLDNQVGSDRDLILVNTQWKRQTDFGFFGNSDQVKYIEMFVPSFYCSNLMVEGEQVRILRSHPGPWRVFLRLEEEGVVEWRQIGDQQIVDSKPATWDKDPANKRDGGKLFDYGQPGYREIETMIVSREGFAPKSLAERASASFTFIKDTL